MRIKSNLRDALVTLNVLSTLSNLLKAASTLNQVQQAIDDTKKEAKRNYREQIKRLHPDKNGGNDEAAKILTAAWNEIKDMKIIQEPPPQPVIHVVVYHTGFWASTSTTTSY